MRLGSPFTLSPRAALMGVLLGLPGLVHAMPAPIMEFLMSEGTGNSVANTGTAGGTATRPSTVPSWSTNAPVNGGAYSLNFATTVNSNYYVEMPTPAALKNLKSFTITGWINSRNLR